MTPRVLAFLAALALASLAVPAEPPDGTAGFLPKDDLGVAAYQRDHPEADGRGVVVAVLDTGLDLLHPALAKTPDGGVKILDFHDATDAGAVDTSFEARVEDGAVTGLSGRLLRVGAKVPTEVRLGLVRADPIYPRGLLRRLRRERKEEREKRKRMAEDRPGDDGPLPPDPGDSVHDLLLYRLEDGWRAVVDTDEDGDLAEETALREYSVAQEVGLLGGRTRLGFGIQVKRDGDLACLLFDGGGHGTHVAGIIAGFHRDGSPLNGLAPGARLLAVKIGNGRFGGATTHHALIQGLEWAGRKGADVVNISFGGPSLFADGREIAARFVDEAVARYGYAVCLSAGNSGPCLSTVGAPATSRRAYSIGAWCSAATQRSNYGVVDPRGGSLFAFSSRGPLRGGAAGVDFIAPGAAVSPVPEWSLVAGRNMNGTSMAAPQMSGALAVILSAAKQDALPITAERLRIACRRAAKAAPGLTAPEQGYGLVDVGRAVEALREMASGPEPVSWIVQDGGWYDRGVVDGRTVSVTRKLTPDLGEDVSAETRTRFQRILRLAPDVPWLAAATPIHASAAGADVHAQIDPSKMTPGLNVGILRAHDAETGEEEARLVVTAIRPIVVPTCGTWYRESITLEAGEKRSLFLRVPAGATRARIETNETSREGGTRIAFRSVDRTSRERAAPLREAGEAGRTTIHHRAVHGGATFEIVLHRPFRATPGASRVDLGVCFRGLRPGTERVDIPTGRFGTHLNVAAGGEIRGRFEAWVDWSEEPIALAWTSSPDPDALELLGEEPLYRHEGVAGFDVPPSKEEVRFDLGFESPFEDYLDDAVYLIEDSNGRNVARGHIWRGPFSFKAPHRGRFLLRVRIWERGRRFLRDGAVFSPVLLRKIRRQNLTVRHDIFEGFVAGGPGGRTFSFGPGQRTGILLLRPGATGATRGTVRFLDDTWSTPLLEVPLRVAPKGLAGDDEARASVLRRFRSLLGSALDRDDVPAWLREALDRQRPLAAAVGLTPADEAGLLLLEARKGEKEAEETLGRLGELAAGKKDRDAALRAHCEARLLAGDAKGALEVLGKIKGDHEETLRLRALLHRDRATEALKHLDRWRKSAPPRPVLARLRFDLLLAAVKFDEADKTLREWTSRFPDRAGDVAEMAAALRKARDHKADLGGEAR